MTAGRTLKGRLLNDRATCKPAVTEATMSLAGGGLVQSQLCHRQLAGGTDGQEGTLIAG